MCKAVSGDYFADMHMHLREFAHYQKEAVGVAWGVAPESRNINIVLMLVSTPGPLILTCRKWKASSIQSRSSPSWTLSSAATATPSPPKARDRES